MWSFSQRKGYVIYTCRLSVRDSTETDIFGPTATDVEGIFRLSGSEKRIKELREAFNSPDRFGKGLDWTGYTVHDAANILRRYFNQLPEPIIPLEFYERFRDPLRNHQSQAVGPIDGQSPSVGDFDPDSTIRIYQNLITELPPLNRQLLLYILDLLAVFASKSDLNKMTTPNLAAIFQPGILSHPSHDMAPPEYRLSQDVLIFLIENQDHFLIGMQGTAADEKTVQEVESGPPTPAIGRVSKPVGRTASNSSKYSASGIRRSVSVSSKQSRNSMAHSPMTPSFHGSNSPLGTPVSGGGVHRSNTVPTNRSPMTAHGGRFQRDLPSHSPSPNVTPGETPMYTPSETPAAYPFVLDASRAENGSLQPYPAAPQVTTVSPSEGSIPVTSAHTGPPPTALPAHDSKTQLEPSVEMANPKPQEAATWPAAQQVSGPPTQEAPPSATGSVPRTFTGIFAAKTPSTDTKEGERKPRKLQKKRLPISANPSANSSTQSLGTSGLPVGDEASFAPISSTKLSQTTPTQSHVQTFLHPASSTETTPMRNPPGNATLITNSPMSPAHSYRSHSEFTEGELDNVEPLDYDMPIATPAGLSSSEAMDFAAEKERKRKFWGRKKGESVSYVPGAYHPAGNTEAQRSRSSVLSSSDRDRERKSITLDRNAALSITSDDTEREGRDPKNPITWIGRKLAERAEKKEEKDRLKEEAKEERRRAKSPPPSERGSGRGVPSGGSMQSLTAAAVSSPQHGQAQAHYAPSPKMEPTHPVNIPGSTGKNIEAGRDYRRSMDVGSSSSGHAANFSTDSPLGSPSFPPRRSLDHSVEGSRERQRSLLDIGEEALVKTNSRDKAFKPE